MSLIANEFVFLRDHAVGVLFECDGRNNKHAANTEQRILEEWITLFENHDRV